MGRYTVEVGDRNILRKDLVGNKAKNLAELSRRALPVPHFFCITTWALRDFLTFNNVSGCDPTRTRELIRSSPIPEPIVKEIERMYRRWAHIPLAVRSSATHEDTHSASWAGQLDSFLWVRGIDQLFEAVKKCWCSLWKENVISYCKNRQIAHDRVGLGVIVQHMVPAELSGVAFTADPLTGADRLIIEPEINDEDLRTKLSKIVKSVGRHFDYPQDVEWAYHRGAFYILQARPITTIKPVWTKAFFDERFPHPVSPLSWSILGELVKRRAFLDPLRYLGYRELKGADIFRLFHGRPYVLVEVFQALYSGFPRFLRPYDWERYFPGPGYLSRKLYVIRQRSRVMRMLISVVSLARDVNWILPLHYRRWQRQLRKWLADIGDLRRLNRSTVSDRVLWRNFERVRSMVDEFLRTHRWSITWAEVLCGVLARKVKGRAALLNLITHVSSKTSEISHAIWRLAQSKDVEGGLDNFLKRYGHRANSLDISFPTWKEDPQFILDLMKSYVHSPDPAQKGAKIMGRQGEGVRISTRAMGLFTRIFFHFTLTWARRMVLLREEQRFYWQMMMAEMRAVFLELGRRFNERNLIDGQEDIFLLTVDEVSQVLDGRFLQLRDLVFKRKRERELDEETTPVPFLIEGSSCLEPLPVGEVIRGVAISPGRAEGRASVVSDMRHYSKVKPGSILVTTGIDPGWTPIMVMISGLVLETGGALSHGAIVARELGLPAVANVRGATQLIPEGARIAVDGHTGEVAVLSETFEVSG